MLKNVGFKSILRVLLLGAGLLLIASSAWTEVEGADVYDKSVQAAKEAGVPGGTIARLENLARSRSLAPNRIAGLIQSLSRAQIEGLPPAPFIDKVEEGMRKGVPPSRIEAALNILHTDLVATKALLSEYLSKHDRPDTELTPELLARTSRTLSMGLTPSTMAEFFAQAPSIPLGRAAGGLEFTAALQQSGLSAQQALALSSTGLQHNFFESIDWDVPLVAKAAIDSRISSESVASALNDVLAGRTSLSNVSRSLGLDPQSLAKGAMSGVAPFGSSPHGSAAGHDGGAASSHGSGTGQGAGPGGGDAGGAAGAGGGSGAGGAGGGPGGGDGGR